MDWIGADATGGKAILAVGVLALIVAAAGSWRGRAAPGLALALGLLALVVAIAGYAGVEKDVDGWNASFARVANIPGFASIRYEVGPGAYLAMVGSGLLALGGAIGLTAAGRSPAGGPASGRFQGPLTGWIVRHAVDDGQDHGGRGRAR